MPVGTEDPDPWATVAVSVTDFGAEPPALATVVVVVGVGVGVAEAIVIVAVPESEHPSLALGVDSVAIPMSVVTTVPGALLPTVKV
jgi:hypothetical protein